MGNLSILKPIIVLVCEHVSNETWAFVQLGGPPRIGQERTRIYFAHGNLLLRPLEQLKEQPIFQIFDVIEGAFV